MAAGLAKKGRPTEPVAAAHGCTGQERLNERLQALIRGVTGGLTLDATGNPHGQPKRVPLGIPDIDKKLDPYPGTDCSQGISRGIIVNGLHEVRAETGLAAGAGAGFALALGLTMAREKLNTFNDQLQAPPALPPVFWIADRYTCSEYGRFYGPGLAAFGLRPEDLIRIHPENREESLWAGGEIAATPGAAAFCLIEIRKHPKEMDLTTTRRLLLRAQASGTPVIVLRQSGMQEASAALTRWCVHPAPSAGLLAESAPEPLSQQFIGPPSFEVSLEKCRGGIANPETTHSSTRWTLEWNADDQCLALAPDPSTEKRTTNPATLPTSSTTAKPGDTNIHPLHRRAS